MRPPAIHPVLLAAALALAPQARAALISADFNAGDLAVSGTFAGPEASATAANAAFGAASTWNALTLPFLGTSVDPSFSSLVDSAGAATAVALTISGGVRAYDNGQGNALRSDYLFFNNIFPNMAPSIDWAISGLVPGGEYRFYAYGAMANAVRTFTMLLDTDADGSFADETGQAVGSAAADYTAATDAYFASVFADASGTIRGRGVGNGNPTFANEANWSGFQLVDVPVVPTVPEPGSLLLALAAAAAAAVPRRRLARAGAARA